MKKLILFLVVLLAVGCAKNEPYSNPYYTKEQLSVIETLCNHEWQSRIPNCPIVDQQTVYFDAVTQPFFVVDRYNSCEVRVDGIYSVWCNSLWTYDYFVLSDDAQTIRCYPLTVSNEERRLPQPYMLNTLIAEKRTTYTKHPADYEIMKDENEEIYFMSIGSKVFEYRSRPSLLRRCGVGVGVSKSRNALLIEVLEELKK